MPLWPGWRVDLIVHHWQWREKGGELRAVLSLSIGDTTGVSWLLIAARRRDLDAGLADGDAVAVLEIDAGILALGSLFRGFAFFATAAFFPVDVGAVHAAEIAQGGLRRAGFEHTFRT